MGHTQRISDIKNVALCFSPLGERPARVPRHLSYYHCLHWQNSVMSPIFSLRQGIAAADLVHVESIFAANKRRKPFDAKAPYFNLLLDARELKKALPLAHQHGWDLTERGVSLNLWSKPEELELPEGYTLWTGRFFDSKIHREFVRSQKLNFGSKPKFLAAYDAMMRTIERRVRAVAILHKSGQVAAMGLVATRGQHAILFSGAVFKKYRGKGLWRQLVAARQLISSNQGARYWTMTTSNPKIIAKGPTSWEMRVLTQSPTPP